MTVAGAIISNVFSLVIAYAIYATIYVALSAFHGRGLGTSLAAGLAACVGLGMLFLGRNSLHRMLTASAGALATIRLKTWYATAILAGWALRLSWVAIFPPVQRADMASYVSLATALIDTGEYAEGGTRAFWPPGLPFALAPFVWLTDGAWYGPLALNLFLFAVTLMASHLLARDLLGEPAARLVTVLLVFWPDHIMRVGLASKELLALPLMVLAILLYLKASSELHRRRYLYSGVAGFALGYGMLTQPSSLLIPAAFALYEFGRRAEMRAALLRLGLLVLIAYAVVAPWTLRNYFVLGAFIPINTAGGMVLYVANNPNATGGFVKPEGIAEGLGEVERNGILTRMAVEWIVENPRDFLYLVVAKNVLFLGNDAGGVYEALKRGLGIDDFRYIALKGLSNLYWLAILGLIALSSLRNPQGYIALHPALLLPISCFLYYFAIHSVFESGARHHLASSTGLAILAASFVSHVKRHHVTD